MASAFEHKDVKEALGASSVAACYRKSRLEENIALGIFTGTRIFLAVCSCREQNEAINVGSGEMHTMNTKQRQVTTSGGSSLAWIRTSERV